jgi:hypothetical protein
VKEYGIDSLVIYIHFCKYTGYRTSYVCIVGDDNLERAWKEVAVTCFKVLPEIYLEIVRKYAKTRIRDSQSPGRYSKRGGLTTEPLRLAAVQPRIPTFLCAEMYLTMMK